MSKPADVERPSRISTFLSYGFRPFFLFGTIYAVAMIGIWVPWFLGIFKLPSAFPPNAWHAHELLFGFIPAVIAGYLLTAVANWTKRPPVCGSLLAALVALWLAGRLAIALPLHINELAVAVICLLFPIALTAIMAREVSAADNRRNYKIAALVAGLAVAQTAFHYEIWLTGRAKLSPALATSLILILLMVIAGRIIPSFTSNWLKANRPGPLPADFGMFDLASNAVSALALAGWVASKAMHTNPTISSIAAILMLSAAAANLARQLRWQPARTFAEPLVAILHVAYLFVAIGFALSGAALLQRDAGLETAGLHAWTSGAFAILMLAMMTRVSRGHTGNTLTAPLSTVVVYICIVLAASTRIAASLMPEMTLVLIPAAGVLWIAAFATFVLLYGRMLLAPRASN